MVSIISTDENKGIAANLLFAILSQGLGFLSSAIMSLVVPRLLGVTDFAYWQLFILYSGYSGIALLGINDGLYLRLGGKRYNDLDFSQIKAEIIIVCGFQIIIAILGVVLLHSLDVEGYRKIILLCVIAFGVVSNISSLFRYIFLSTNLTQIASFSDLIFRALFLLCLGIAAVFGSLLPLFLIGLYIVCQLTSLVYVLFCGRALLSSSCRFDGLITNCCGDVVSGIKVMISYYSDSLIVGLTRMLVDWRLGLIAFANVSLSFTLTNFILLFVSQVSLVIFPSLKRLPQEQKRKRYFQLRSVLDVVLPASFLLFIPLKYLLGLWLPQYENGLQYLALVMPLCVYNSRANFLFNTFYKIERMETELCIINLVAMLCNLLISIVSVCIFESLEISVAGVVVTVAIRDFVFEKLLLRYWRVFPNHNRWSSAAYVLIFMVVSWFLDVAGWPIIVISYFIYLYFNRNSLSTMTEIVHERIQC